MDKAYEPLRSAEPAPTRVAIVTERGPRLADIAPFAIAIVAAALFLYLFSGVLMPFVAGIALGYLLDPVAEKLERLGFNRLGAALFILGVSLVVIVLALVLIGPILGHQLSAFVENLPKIVVRLQTLVSDWSTRFLASSWGGDLAAKLGLGAGSPGDGAEQDIHGRAVAVYRFAVENFHSIDGSVALERHMLPPRRNERQAGDDPVTVLRFPHLDLAQGVEAVGKRLHLRTFHGSVVMGAQHVGKRKVQGVAHGFGILRKRYAVLKKQPDNGIQIIPG